MNTAVDCPSCHSTDTQTLSECTAPTELDSEKTQTAVREMIEPLRNSVLIECNTCGLLFRVPGLTTEELTFFYRNLPETIWRYEPSDVGSWAYAAKTLKRIHSSDKPIDVIDVGAFRGGFLKQLPERWRRAAIEPSPEGQTSLRESGVEVIGEYIESIDEASGHEARFDVVTLFDVFEHLPKPIDTLNALTRLMKPGGRLLLSTGNTDHWSWKLLQGAHWYLHSVQHLCFGNPRYFRHWAKQQNLVVEKILHHPHKLAPWTGRLVQGLETVHCWSVRQQKTLLARLIQTLPGCRDWMHRNGRMVFANSLKDHLLVCFRKPGSTR